MCKLWLRFYEILEDASVKYRRRITVQEFFLYSLHGNSI